jgi:hypothetical protein
MARLTRKQIREGLEQTPIDALIVANPREARLTAKQREFARLVALGETKAQSYRQAYKSKGNSKTVANKGYQLTKRDDIQTTIADFAKAKQFADSHTAEQLRAFVIQQLTQHASDPDIPPAQRIKALELIGKHHGVDSFITRSEVIHTKSSGDIRARILDKLQLIGASSTVEAHKAEDDDADADSLLAELTPTHAENAQDETHPTATPQIVGDDDTNPTHTIPHTQTSPIPHNRTKVFSDHAEDIPDAEWTDTPSDSSLSTDTEPLPDGNTVWKAAEDEIVTCNVSGEKI